MEAKEIMKDTILAVIGTIGLVTLVITFVKPKFYTDALQAAAEASLAPEPQASLYTAQQCEEHENLALERLRVCLGSNERYAERDEESTRALVKAAKQAEKILGAVDHLSIECRQQMANGLMKEKFYVETEYVSQ